MTGTATKEGLAKGCSQTLRRENRPVKPNIYLYFYLATLNFPLCYCSSLQFMRANKTPAALNCFGNLAVYQPIYDAEIEKLQMVRKRREGRGGEGRESPPPSAFRSRKHYLAFTFLMLTFGLQRATQSLSCEHGQEGRAYLRCDK